MGAGILTRRAALPRGLLLALAGAALYLAVYQLPAFWDWSKHFYPAAAAWDYQLYNPPWLLAILKPFTILPVHAAGALWVTLSLLVICYACHKLGADRLGMVLALTTPATWFLITLGQLEALLLLGLVIERRPWDVLLLAIKPQVIGTAILFRLRDYDRRAVGYLAAFLLVSLVVWPGWPAEMLARWWRGGEFGGFKPLSLAIFPYGIPAGLALFWYAWRRQNAGLGALSSFFFVPYLGPGSHIVYIVLLLSKGPRRLRVAGYAGYWAFCLFWLSGGFNAPIPS